MRHLNSPLRLRLLLAGIGLVACVVALAYGLLLADLPDPRQGADAAAPAPSVLISDRHGRLLYEIIDPAGSKHVPLPLTRIPLACQHATIATEDGRFYQHPGVDLLAIVRAAWQNWRTGSAVGASTLTQQLARNLYLSSGERVERSLRRKLREAWLAWRLERVYSKDELLALYLNTTYYGHFAVGIEAAAQAYFGMAATDLDLAQCALLAGLPQYPAGYNPIENPAAAAHRQKIVLGLMARDGYIGREQADEAGRERLAYASTPFPIEAPHFVMWVQSQLEELLGPERVRQGGLRVTTTLDLDWQRQAQEAVKRRLAQLRPCVGADDVPGVTCDPNADPIRRVENAALVALDPRTGAVLAMVGSPDYFDPQISGAVNATLSLRQPGSAIKPLTYAAAFDPKRAAAVGQAPWTPATLIADVRSAFPTAEGESYVPLNYDLTFHGPVTVRTALANSYNIPAVKALDYVGVDALVELAGRLGIPWGDEAGSWAARSAGVEAGNWGLVAESRSSPASSFQLQASRFGLALTLGGGEVRLLDLTAAYAAFANGGQRVEPFGISQVEPLEGGEIGYPVLDTAWPAVPGMGDSAPRVSLFRASGTGDETPQYLIPNTQPPLDPRVAFLVTDILSDELARMPAFGAGNVLEIGRPAAAKTGTTSDWRDNWTMGYTPDLAVGVWVGNADNAPMRDVSGITGAGPIWHDFITAVLRDTPPTPFPRPDGLVQVEVCADSGLLPDSGFRMVDFGLGQSAAVNPASRGGAKGPLWASSPQSSIAPCPHRRYEWFIVGTEPTEVDQQHRRVALDIRTGRPAADGTPAEHVAYETLWLMPEELAEWAASHGIFQPAADDGVWAELPVATAAALTLVSPDANRTYRLDPALPVELQRLPISARVGRELAARAQP